MFLVSVFWLSLERGGIAGLESRWFFYYCIRAVIASVSARQKRGSIHSEASKYIKMDAEPINITTPTLTLINM